MRIFIIIAVYKIALGFVNTIRSKLQKIPFYLLTTTSKSSKSKSKMGYAIAAATIFFTHRSYSNSLLRAKTQVGMLLNKEIPTNNALNSRDTCFIFLYNN